ncbi:MAG: NAD-dependent epimerase/dehydratase family protein, partial [Candidatus Bathyarchaeota archaeon]
TIKEHVNRQDVVFHLAAIRGEFSIPWKTYYRINVEATRRLTELSFQSGVSTLVYVSSVGVHGTSPSRVPADEQSPYNPDSSYHRSKMMAEQVIQGYADSLDTVIVRPTITYGPSDTGFLHRVARIARTGFFPIVGEGANRVHLLHIDGLTALLARVMVEHHTSGRIYIAADKSPIRFRDLVKSTRVSAEENLRFIRIPFTPFLRLAEAYDRLIAPALKARSLEISFRLLSQPWYYSIKRAVKELGYHPHETESNVKKTVQWYFTQGWL